MMETYGQECGEPIRLQGFMILNLVARKGYKDILKAQISRRTSKHLTVRSFSKQDMVTGLKQFVKVMVLLSASDSP